MIKSSKAKLLVEVVSFSSHVASRCFDYFRSGAALKVEPCRVGVGPMLPQSGASALHKYRSSRYSHLLIMSKEPQTPVVCQHPSTMSICWVSFLMLAVLLVRNCVKLMELCPIVFCRCSSFRPFRWDGRERIF